MTRKALFFSALFFLLAQFLSAQDRPKIQVLISKLEESILKKDFSIIEPLMDEKFRFNDYDGSMAKLIFRQVVVKYPGNLKKVSIQKITEENGIYNVSCLFEKDTVNKNYTIRISPGYKLLEANIAAAKVVHGNGNIQGHNDKRDLAGIRRNRLTMFPGADIATLFLFSSLKTPGSCDLFL